jgi:Flp pilus assembly protein TadD
MYKKSLSLFTLSVALLSLGSVTSFAQNGPQDVMSFEDTGVEEAVAFDGVLSNGDDGMLPMPSASQTEIVPDVDFPPAEPKGVLSAPTSVVTSGDVLKNSKDKVTGGENLYFDSITKDRDLRDSDIPRRVDPRYEPGSRYIIVEKTAKADSRQAALVAAKRALNLGRYSSALEMFETLYKENKRDPHVLMGLAVAQQNSGFNESAIRTYEELLEISPDNVDANVNMLGLIKRQYPSVAYRRLVDLWDKNPRNAGLAAQIGLTSAELGNNDDAIHYLGVAASLEPNNANHYYNMAVIVDRAGAQKQAVQYYEKALELDATYGGSRTVPRDSIYDRLSKLRRL